MHLSAMMDLMLEQVREQSSGEFGLYACTTHHGNRRVESHVVEGRAGLDEPPVHGTLRGRKGSAGVERFLGLEEAIRLCIGLCAAQASLQRVDVVPVHGEDVVERGLDRRKEAR